MQERTPEKEKPSFSTARRWGIWLNLFFSTVAIFALIVMANYLAAGYFKRFQVGSNARVELSQQTVKILQSLTNDIDVTIFFDATEDDEVYAMVSGLLKEYQNASPHIKLRSLDFTRYPGDAALLMSKYKLNTDTDRDLIIFDSNGQSKIIYKNQLSDYDINAVLQGETKEFRRTAFKGEMLFTSAIFSVAHPRALKAYFLQGHGEHDPNNSSHDYGFAKFASLLKEENNVEWQKLQFTGTNEVPSDCQLLIIGGPMKAQLATGELTAIDNYLNKGGRMLVLLNYLGGTAGTEQVLSKWGITPQANVVLDQDNSHDGRDVLTSELNPSHPVTRAMFGEGLRIQLVMPRSLERSTDARGSAEGPKVEFLAATSTNASAHFPIQKEGAVEYRKVPGIFPLMAAIEQGNIKGITAERGATRVIVVGDSVFLSNHLIDSAANRYFAVFAVNWLLAQPNILLEGLGPRPIKEYKITLSAGQVSRLNVILLGVIPGAILLFGGLVWFRRRS
jgi:hypothetical protein